MTVIRAAEVGGAVVVATVTTAGAVVEAGLPEWVTWVVPIGAGIIAGYYSARLTTEKAITRLETRLDSTDQAIREVTRSIDEGVGGLRDEMRWYYQRKGPGG